MRKGTKVRRWCGEGGQKVGWGRRWGRADGEEVGWGGGCGEGKVGEEGWWRRMRGGEEEDEVDEENKEG